MPADLVLGVDPGLAATGWALVERRGSRLVGAGCGTLRTLPRTAHAERLAALNRGIGEILAGRAVVGAAVESWFVHPVSRAAMAMAEARGAVLVAIAQAGVEVAEYPPTEIKKAVTGSGSADKAQVRVMVAALCGTEPDGDHAADALAAAICHLSRAPLRAAIRRAQ